VNEDASPMMLRRRLRTELRNARLKAGLTQEQVAKAMVWSLSKMIRIETAQTGISVNDLKALLSAYGITDKDRIAELVDLAQAARRAPWWRPYTEFAPPALLQLIDYESAASAVSQFETMFVPGILQIEEYASAILEVFYDERSSDERVAALVDLRTKRRDLLTSKNAPKFSFVLDESVIQRLVGSPAIMNRQLRHLVDVTELSNVTIQLVPFAAGLHPGMKGPFEVVQFEDSPDESVVFVEEPRGDFISDNPREAQGYLDNFERIAEKALRPSDSVDLLRGRGRHDLTSK
jgi:transcriptional regulator with XRE-family HTH domain